MAKTRLSPAEKKIVNTVDEACQRLSHGYQIDIMKISDMHKAGMVAARSGGDVDATVQAWLEANAKKA